MLPVPFTETVASLLKRVAAHTKNAKPSRIFVHETFEVLDHSLTVGACFTDFMEIVVHAFLENSAKDV